MPIEIKECDGGMGNIIESRGTLTDQELTDSLKLHLTQARENFKKYKFILIDHTELSRVDVTDETAELIAGLCADTSKLNPDTIVAMAAYVPIGANMDLVDKIQKLHELFIYRSSWKTMLFRTRPQAVRWIREQVNAKFGIDNLTFE